MNADSEQAPDPTDRLIDLAALDPDDPKLGRLSEEEQRSVERIREAIRLVSSAGRFDESEPSPAIVRRIKSAFVERNQRLDRLGAMVASLVRREPAAAPGYRAARGDHTAEYQSEMGSLFIRLTPSERIESEWRLQGEFVPQDERSGASGVRCSPLDGEAIVAESSLDEFGYFALQVPRGVYDLTISTDRGEVIAEAVEVG